MALDVHETTGLDVDDAVYNASMGISMGASFNDGPALDGGGAIVAGGGVVGDIYDEAEIDALTGTYEVFVAWEPTNTQNIGTPGGVAAFGDLSAVSLLMPRGGFRWQQLDRLGLASSKVASARAIMTLGSPTLTTTTYEYSWESEDPGGAIFCEARDLDSLPPWHCLAIGVTVESSLSCSVRLMALKGSGDTVHPVIIQTAGAAATMGDGTATVDATDYVKAYLDNMGSAYAFEHSVVTGEPTLASVPTNLAETMQAVRDAYFTYGLAYEYWSDYSYTGYDWWPIGTIAMRKLTYSQAGISRIFVTLVDGSLITIDAADRVHYRNVVR